jgi:hypothetical protein
MGVFMKLRGNECKNNGTAERKEGKFPKKVGLVETMKRRAALLAVIVVSTVAIACSDESGGNSGSGGDAGVSTETGGTQNTGGRNTGGEDSSSAGSDTGVVEPEGLCAEFPDRHVNRKVFTLGSICSPGDECSDYVVLFRELGETSGGMRAVFAALNTTNPTNSDFIGMDVGEQKTHDFPEVGETVLELCSTTAAECQFQITGDPIGDAHCTATVAASRSWCE